MGCRGFASGARRQSSAPRRKLAVLRKTFDWSPNSRAKSSVGPLEAGWVSDLTAEPRARQRRFPSSRARAGRARPRVGGPTVPGPGTNRKFCARFGDSPARRRAPARRGAPMSSGAPRMHEICDCAHRARPSEGRFPPAGAAGGGKTAGRGFRARRAPAGRGPARAPAMRTIANLVQIPRAERQGAVFSGRAMAPRAPVPPAPHASAAHRPARQPPPLRGRHAGSRSAGRPQSVRGLQVPAACKPRIGLRPASARRRPQAACGPQGAAARKRPADPGLGMSRSSRPRSRLPPVAHGPRSRLSPAGGPAACGLRPAGPGAATRWPAPGRARRRWPRRARWR